MDGIFYEMERIQDQYITIGSTEGPMSDKWVKVAILQNLPKKVVQTLVVELKKADSVEDIYSIINTHFSTTQLVYHAASPAQWCI